MLKWFKPTWMLPTVYNITPNQLKERGIKALFSDLDNTLIPWNRARGTLRLFRWQRKLAIAHVKVVIISNNTHHRVAQALSTTGLHFVSWSLKPLPFGIDRALGRYHLARNQVIMVGDQLLTDIWAANNSHVKSVLVKPLVRTDSWNTRINRYFEKIIKKKLRQRYRFLTWQKDLDHEK